MKFDAVIVGAGSAGSMSALALCKKGFNAVLIDRKEQERIGKKVCGDAIARHHLDISQEEVGFGYPEGDELKQEIDGLDIYSPNGENRLRLTISDDDGWIIDRYLFGQRLLNSALDAGAELMASTKFKDLLTKNHVLSGIRVRTNEGDVKELNGNIVVDATGSTAVLRRSLPDRYYNEFLIEKEIDPRDMGFAYREIVKTREMLEDDRYLRLYFINSLVPGGYAWIFPTGRGYSGANAGAGGDLASMNNPKEKFKLFTEQIDFFDGAETLDAGSGKVPIRRPLNTLVGDNFMLVGDTGSQVNPLHGGGLGVSIEGGIKLARAYEKAQENNDFTVAGLWSYNTSYQRESGAVHAPLDIFRLVITKFSDKALNVTLANGVISQEDVNKLAIKKKFEFTTAEKAMKVWRGKSIIRKVLKLQMLGKKMSQISQIYEKYPDNLQDLPEWIKKVKAVYRGL
ncbi:MAG: geranylgeranyl reductase family protein [Candidatus Odinarchaeota archaeon]